MDHPGEHCETRKRQIVGHDGKCGGRSTIPQEAELNGGAASFAERKHGKVVANTMAAVFYVPIGHR